MSTGKLIGFAIKVGGQFLAKGLGEQPSWSGMADARILGDAETAKPLAQLHGGHVYRLYQGAGVIYGVLHHA